MNYDKINICNPIILERCNFCGAENCQSHHRYHDRCIACGKRYAKYASYKSLQKSEPTFKRAKLLRGIVEDYENFEQQGYRVPRDIHDIGHLI